MSSYSKGSRGLSVLPRVHCIFTASSISLSLGWRQPGHHYAIRAGRNLPDKEFRYLRTVIVTAAVYRGFDECFAFQLSPFLPLGRRETVSPYLSVFMLLWFCVFFKPLDPADLFDFFRRARPRFCGSRDVTQSFGTILHRSSLKVLSIPLLFYLCPSVSLWGVIWCFVVFRGFRGYMSLYPFSPVMTPQHS